MLRTCAFSFALLLSSLCTLHAQNATPADSARTAAPKEQPVRGVQYASREEAAAALLAQKKLPLLAGISVSADVCGAFMAACTTWGQYEAAARFNLRGKYFPIVEIGIGTSNKRNETTNILYKVHSPYYRVGLDYNFIRDPHKPYRLFGGVRYGFSSFTYDVDGPDITDANYGGTTPLHFTGVRGTNHWGELVFGLETKVWSFVRLGWSFRYRIRLYNKESALGSPWYVPGYGRNEGHVLGGTFNVVFDLSHK